MHPGLKASRTPRRPGKRRAVLALLLSCWATMALARSQVCAQGAIAVTAPSAADLDQACRAVAEARPFLAGIGLTLPAGIRIHLARDLGGMEDRPHEVARYDGGQCAIRMLDFAAARRAMPRADGSGLNVAMNRALWRSYLVHELTHAAVHASCGQVCPDRAGHEYIAAVAQLSSLPEPLRNEILRGYDKLQAFAGPAEISEIYYALGPVQFMVKSYRHYLTPGNGRAFVRDLLKPAAGGALAR